MQLSLEGYSAFTPGSFNSLNPKTCAGIYPTKVNYLPVDCWAAMREGCAAQVKHPIWSLLDKERLAVLTNSTCSALSWAAIDFFQNTTSALSVSCVAAFSSSCKGFDAISFASM